MPGLDRQVIDAVDVDQVFRRIPHDSRTDLVGAPHYDLVYDRGATRLWAAVSQLLSSGRYEPDLPIELSVPKPRGFNRPGGISTPNGSSFINCLQTQWRRQSSRALI